MMKEKLEKYLKENKIDAKIHNMNKEIKTVEEASEALSTDSENIVKTLVFITEKEPILVITSGLSKVDKDKLKDVLNSKELRMASPSEVKNSTGYQIGEVPPIGIKLKKIVDKNILEREKVFGGGGTRKKIIEISPDKIIDERTIITSVNDNRG